jgi:RNA polymerase sigma-70 factor (ECF subfamily)
MGASAAERNGGSHDTEALYREHGAAVAALCRALLRDRAEAEDATQQVFLSAHRALLNGAAPREPLAWLLMVARHECYARFRQRTARPVPSHHLSDEAAPDASLHVLRADELETMWDEVTRMPTAQREAFLLREIRGLSYGQLADELSLSAPSVRSLLTRARARLRHRLRDVTAGFSTAPWVQPLVRMVPGGDGTSPFPAATKAAAIGVGTLALVGGGSLSPGAHRPPRTPEPAIVARHGHALVPHSATPVGLAVAPTTARHTSNAGASEPEHSQRSDGSSGSHEGSGDHAGSSDGRSTRSGHDSSDGTTVVAQPTTDGGGSSDTTSSISAGDGSRDGSSGTGSSGSGSSSDGGSDTTTTVTTSGSDGSGSSGGDSGHGGG